MGANDYRLGREEIPEVDRKGPDQLAEKYEVTEAAQDPNRTLLYDAEGGDEFYDDASGEEAWLEADDAYVYDADEWR